jgi:lipoate-protein ligase A
VKQSKWQFWLDTEPRPGWANMAVDAGLLDLAEQGHAVLRVYQWSPPCLSFGRNEPALRRYDRDRIAQLGIDTVRRPTGGRAVWHADELTYAVAAPGELLGALREAYRTIHQLLAGALHRLGAPVALAPAPATSPSLGSGACFAAPVGGELVLDAGKLVGSAQVRQGSALLQHGSLLLGGSQSVASDVTLGDSPALRDSTLAAALGRVVTFDEVALAVRDAAFEWQREWHEVRDSGPLLDAASPHEDRFRSPDWTWRR